MFPLDFFEEILLRSDAKDLVPWKRVCKSWYSLISSPHFAKAHLKTTCHNSGNELGHVRIAMPTYWKMPNVKLFEYNQWKLAGSSHGLVCFYRTDKVSLLGIVNDQMCIYFLDRNTYQPQEIWVMRSYNVEHSWEALPNNYEMKHQVVYHMKMVEYPSPKNRRMSFFCDDNKCLSRALKYWKACRYVPSLVSPDAAIPSHTKHNKISVKSWSIKAVKGEKDQHSHAMLRRTIAETSKQEAREIEKVYREEVGETENLYLHEDGCQRRGGPTLAGHVEDYCWDFRAGSKRD